MACAPTCVRPSGLRTHFISRRRSFLASDFASLILTMAIDSCSTTGRHDTTHMLRAVTLCREPPSICQAADTTTFDFERVVQERS
jgi:hypothetical protein